MKTQHILLASLLALVFAPAQAWQIDADLAVMEADSDDLPAKPPALRERIVRHPGPMGDFAPQFLHGRSGKHVKNAPYSAEAVNEYQQQLADGNQIVSRRSSMNYRDSAGRTRHEVRDESGAVRNITISDPNEGITYMLRPETKTAIKMGSHRDIARIASETARAHIDRIRTNNGERVIIKRIEREEGSAERAAHGAIAPRHEEIRIRVAPDMAARGPLPGMDRVGPAIAGAFGDMKWSTKATTKDLGTKEMEGVKVHGKMRSYEIPAGEIGNRNPIVVNSESWYAPDLQVTVLTRHSDPRSGDRIYRLSNIKRDEPAASLFTLPTDYTVKDPMAEVRKSLDARKGPAGEAAK